MAQGLARCFCRPLGYSEHADFQLNRIAEVFATAPWYSQIKALENSKEKLMRSHTKMKFTFVFFATLIFLGGCGAQIALLNPPQTFGGTDSMVLNTRRTDILEVIASVGKSMNYTVSALDKNAGYIGLSADYSRAGMLFTGKQNQSNLMISIKEGGKRLDISVSVIGNFGSGGQEAATEIVDNFKSKLKEQLARKQ